MKIKKLRSSNEAVVGIVVAVLLIGLMVSVIALMQTQYVPKWMKQKEAEHMEEVMSQFTFMKFAMDTQVATTIETPIATAITLGSKELPYLVSQRSYGQLDILSGSDSGFKINMETVDSGGNQLNTYDTDTIVGDTYPGIGTIRFSSANAYYLDQSFILESGAFITWQSDGYDFTIKPPFTIKDDGNVIIKINLVDSYGIGGKIQASGYGTTAIMTEYSQTLIDNTDPPVDEYVSEITITSNYKDEWHSFIYSLLESSTFLDSIDEDPADPDFTISPLSDDSILVTFINVNPKLELKVHEINAQVGPGWID